MSKWQFRDQGKIISASVIKEKTQEELSVAHKFLTGLLELKKFEKLYDTYAIGVETAIENNKANKVFVDYKIDGTVTGRLSCSQYKAGKKKMGVSFHTLPRIDDDAGNELDVRGIRGCFVAPKGYAFITADQKAEELRVLAHIANESAMIKAFESGEDLHYYVASLLFKKPIKDIQKKERQIAKTVSFLIVYGGGPFNLANTVGIPIEEAEAIVRRYKKVFPGVDSYMQKVNEFTLQNKYISTIFGRTRNLVNVASADKKVVFRALRQAVNFTVQSVSTDIVLMSGLGIVEDIEKYKLDARLAAFVHDSIEGIVKIEHIKQYLEILYLHMIENPIMRDRFGVSFKVPFEIDVEVGHNFGSGVSVKFVNGSPSNMEEILTYMQDKTKV